MIDNLFSNDSTPQEVSDTLVWQWGLLNIRASDSEFSQMFEAACERVQELRGGAVPCRHSTISGVTRVSNGDKHVCFGTCAICGKSIAFMTDAYDELVSSMLMSDFVKCIVGGEPKAMIDMFIEVLDDAR